MNAPSFRLDRYDTLVLDEVIHIIVHRDSGSLTIAPGDGGPARTYANHELLELYYDRRLRIMRNAAYRLSPALADRVSRPLDAFETRHAAEALRRLEYVQACDQLFSRFRGDPRFTKRPETGYSAIARIVRHMRIAAIAKETGLRACPSLEKSICGTTLRNWRRDYLASGREVSALVPNYTARGHTRQIPEKFRDIIEQVVRTYWLTMERPSVSVIYPLVQDRVEELRRSDRDLAAEPDPSKMAVHRWIAENISQYEQVARREGPKSAEAKVRASRPAPNSGIPLRVVEIDHTKLDLMLIDGDKTRRAWLTVAIDAETRMICGYNLDYEAPSWESVMKTLRMAVMPKDLSDIPGSSPWPVLGVPEIIKLDNGREFHSKSLKSAAAQLKIELRYCQPGQPHLKGRVERFFGEVARDFCAMIAGRTFANSVQKSEYNSVKLAILPIDRARTLFKRWVVDVYHNREHGGLLGKTPLRRWGELAPLGVRLPPKMEDLSAFVSTVLSNKIRRTGIHWKDLIYWSEEADLLRTRPGGHEVEYVVKIDPEDITKIMVLDSERGRWLIVPCVNRLLGLASGVSLRQWLEIRQLAKLETPKARRTRLDALREARKKILHESKRKRLPPAKAPPGFELTDQEMQLSVKPTSAAAAGRTAAVDLPAPQPAAKAAPPSVPQPVMPARGRIRKPSR